jgi:GNAT superfamily N-acetyltransferase
MMLASMSGRAPEPGPWQWAAAETLRKRLTDPETDATMVAYVVETPDRPGTLAACAVGTIEYRLGGPENPSGEIGYVFNVSTDPDYRRRGYSRACLLALLSWYRRRGVTRIDLGASPEGEPLYRDLGFVRRGTPAMRLKLTPTED